MHQYSEKRARSRLKGFGFVEEDGFMVRLARTVYVYRGVQMVPRYNNPVIIAEIGPEGASLQLRATSFRVNARSYSYTNPIDCGKSIERLACEVQAVIDAHKTQGWLAGWWHHCPTAKRRLKRCRYDHLRNIYDW